jgi:adenylate kinase
MLRLIILGPPGAGKGTQAKLLCRDYSIPHISTGDILRKAITDGTPLGKEVKSILARGALVSDELIFSLVKARLLEPDCENGFLFDGFPRTIPQAEAMVSVGIEIDAVIEIEVADEVIIERLAGRRLHPSSGRLYHVNAKPPKIPGVDDETGERLIQREDDKEEVIRHRLSVYHEETSVLVDFYQGSRAVISGQSPQYFKFSGNQSMSELAEAIKASFKQLV